MKLAWVLVAAALGACNRTEPAAALAPAPSPAAPAHPVPAPQPAAGAVLPAETLQLVTAVIPTWDATTAQLRLWQRPAAGRPWKLVLGPWDAVIGKTGAGWGMGLHGRGPFPGRTGPLKQEGDGRSPAGAFLLQRTFGYADQPPAHSQLPYQQSSEDWKCVDDSASDRYTLIVDRKTVPVDWTSAEDMRRADALYTWVVDVGHNPTRIPRGGSCIFLHVWAGPTSTTVGCTAMEEPRLAQLIGELSLAQAPVFVLLPRAEYEALAAPWELPPL